MQTLSVQLSSPPSKSFRCEKAANALDIDIAKKLTHELKIDADITTPFNVGLIVGASGSGKTTLARQVYGDDFEKPLLNPKTPVIDQFPKDWSYEQCAQALGGMGLASVPCWIRPAGTLSNGQRARAEAALQLAREIDGPILIDEWTSVVDRTVAKAMSLCLAKHARRQKRQCVLLSCHYDIIEWLSPDWIIDCNTMTYSDRRGHRWVREEKLDFEIRPVESSTWKAFSRYHYLSDKIPGGLTKCFGLFHKGDQIGFQAFSNYVPKVEGKLTQMHSNRTVIHPDYQGFGLGGRVIDATSIYMAEQGYDVRAKFSSLPVFKAFKNNPNWQMTAAACDTKVSAGGSMLRVGGFRLDVQTWSFRWVGPGSRIYAAKAKRKSA